MAIDKIVDRAATITVTPEAVSDKTNSSTGQFTLPSGTDAQRPVTSFTGAQRYNTDLGVMEYYNGTIWLKIAAEQTVLDSVTGDITDAYETTLTLAGSGFLTDTLTVNFTQISDAIDVDVTVTATSDTDATVNVPSSVYSNVTAGNVVSISVTNVDNTVSGTVTKTAVGAPSGGTITTSGGYRYHTFTSSSNFVVPTGFSKTYDALIVAGGASGGAANGGANGGGGAGGAIEHNAFSLSSSTYTITIGAGGSGVTSSIGNNGSNTTAFSQTAIGGGGGDNRGGTGASSGGSGGGGSSSGSSNYGAATSGQGNRGGVGRDDPNSNSIYPAGGGGGKGAQGADAVVDGPSGDGGDGINWKSLGTYYAGGGGGGAYTSSTGPGAGGQGGGGAGPAFGNAASSANNGSVNTGGGGGGGSSGAYLSGSGGSGIVIVRYAM